MSSPTAGAGIPYDRYVVLAMAVAGGFGGLAAAIMLQGDQYVLKDGFTSGYGFDGLVVGLFGTGFQHQRRSRCLVLRLLRSGGINMEMTARFLRRGDVDDSGFGDHCHRRLGYWLSRDEATIATFVNNSPFFWFVSAASHAIVVRRHG